MERVVVVDRSLESLLNRRDPESRTTQVGLCVGTYTPQIEVLDCVPTPEEEGVAESSGLNAESLGQSLIDHSYYLTKALPGGVTVLGVYIIAEGSELTAFRSHLKRAVKKINDAGATSDGVVLEVDNGSGKLSAFLIKTPKGSNTEEKCRIQFCRTEPLVPVFCSYPLQVSFPLTEETPPLKTIRKQILASVSASLQEASGLLNGTALVVDQKIGDEERASIQLLSPLGSRAEIGDMSVRCNLTVRGVLDCRAMCHSTDTVLTATELLKGDVLNSLRSRFQLMEEIEDEAKQGDLPSVQALPRRVWGSWKFGIQLCDYLTAEETSEDAVRNLQDLVQFTFTQMEDREKPPHLGRPAPWDPFQRRSKRSQNSRGRQIWALYGLSVLVAALAILVGMWLYRLQPQHTS